jgi:hypothetical protein
VIANQSVFNVASSGKCKTHIIFSISEACKTIPDLVINNWNSVTYYELVQKIALLIGKRLLWTVEEWSMLTDYHRELLMAVASKVQTDRKFERMVSAQGVPVTISIQDCDLVLIIAIQPFKFRKLMRESENWNSLANDRFIKLMLNNPLQKDTKKEPPKFSMPTLTQPFPHFVPNKDVLELMEMHLTRSRAELATIRYMNAWCQLNGGVQFEEKDGYAFKTIYWPYLELYNAMILSSDPDREESFHTGPFRIIEYFMTHWKDDVTINDLEKHFHIASSDDLHDLSQSTMYRHLRLLRHKGIIKNNSPTWSLAPRWRDYFERYKENWS